MAVRRYHVATDAMTGRRWLLWVVLVVGALVMLFPIYWMFATAVTPGGIVQGTGFYLWPPHTVFGNFVSAWNSQPVDVWFVNSMIVTAGGVVVTVVISMLSGYAFAKFRFRGRTVLFFGYLITVMIPLQVIMVPEFVILSKLHLDNSMLGVILPGAANGVCTFIARQFMLSIPDELIEASKMDGARALTTFWRVVVPMCWPLISVLVIVTFVARWNDFLWPLIVLESPNHFTLPIGLNTLNGTYSSPQDQIMAITLMSVIPAIAIFGLFQRRFVEGIATTGLK
jgi:multiple sugar transport system permease protein/alpha-1,4-digalacturonate transport system permease protein